MRKLGGNSDQFQERLAWVFVTFGPPLCVALCSASVGSFSCTDDFASLLDILPSHSLLSACFLFLLLHLLWLPLLNTQPLGFLCTLRFSSAPWILMIPKAVPPSSNLFPSLIQIQILIHQLLIMQTVFALFLGYLPSVTLNLSSSPFSPCLAHLLFPVCWHWVRQWPSVTRRNKLQVIWDSFQFWD